jgi:predicted MPP superfamily phosphohydrolase
MTIIYSLIILIALLILYMYFETTWLKVERLDFSGSGKGLKIIHLTDLHIYMTGVPANRLRKVVKEENPDLILISGDYINSPLQAADFLVYLHTVCNSYKTIICLGNHDIRSFDDSETGLDNFINEIEALGVKVLRNANVLVEAHGKKYNIIGIDDLGYGMPDIEKALKGCVADAPKIALTHNPDIALQIPGKIVDYLFCGHFHGGQIYMPFNLEFFLLRKEQLCRMGITRGLRKINGIKVYLNRGVGNVVVPLRFLSRPEILVCYIP